MRLTTILLLILTCAAVVSAQSPGKCFEFGGLKDNHVFRFQTHGGDVAGSYRVERDYDAEQSETYDFSGTRAGSNLKVKFFAYAKFQTPPFEIKTAILTVAKSGGAEILKVKFYGKGKSAVYSMRLESCEPSFETLQQTAKRIDFAKGADSATVTPTFAGQSERKSFLLRAAMNQTISVFSPGCAIDFFYPDKTENREPGIDTFETERLSQTGDYLFVISPAGEPGECATTFTVTN